MCYGNILNINHYTDKPLSYLTTGQIVPEDIKKATMESLLSMSSWGEPLVDQAAKAERSGQGKS